MLIECTYGPVTTEVMGTQYVFTPDDFNRCVAEVMLPRHIAAFLAVTAYYREVQKDPTPLVLESIDPDTAEIGGQDLTMICTGTGFFADSVIVFNESPEPTEYMSPTQLTTVVKPSTASGAGTFPVYVRNGDGMTTDVINFSFTEVVPGTASEEPELGEENAPMAVTMINGIGPAMESKLAAEGITDVRQIAEWTPEEAQEMDDRLALAGRIARDDWIGQAKALVG